MRPTCVRCRLECQGPVNFLLKCSDCFKHYHHRCHIPPVQDAELVRRIKATTVHDVDNGLDGWVCATCLNSQAITSARPLAFEAIEISDDEDGIEVMETRRPDSTVIAPRDASSPRLPTTSTSGALQLGLTHVQLPGHTQVGQVSTSRLPQSRFSSVASLKRKQPPSSSPEDGSRKTPHIDLSSVNLASWKGKGKQGVNGALSNSLRHISTGTSRNVSRSSLVTGSRPENQSLPAPCPRMPQTLDDVFTNLRMSGGVASTPGRMERTFINRVRMMRGEHVDSGNLDQGGPREEHIRTEESDQSEDVEMRDTEEEDYVSAEEGQSQSRDNRGGQQRQLTREDSFDDLYATPDPEDYVPPPPRPLLAMEERLSSPPTSPSPSLSPAHFPSEEVSVSRRHARRFVTDASGSRQLTANSKKDPLFLPTYSRSPTPRQGENRDRLDMFGSKEAMDIWRPVVRTNELNKSLNSRNERVEGRVRIRKPQARKLSKREKQRVMNDSIETWGRIINES